MAPTDKPCHRVRPREQVYIKVFRKKHVLSPRWKRPYEVLLATSIAIKIKEKSPPGFMQTTSKWTQIIAFKTTGDKPYS